VLLRGSPTLAPSSSGSLDDQLLFWVFFCITYLYAILFMAFSNHCYGVLFSLSLSQSLSPCGPMYRMALLVLFLICPSLFLCLFLLG